MAPADQAAADRLRADSARYFWHPMAHPRQAASTPPRIYESGEGTSLTDVDGNTVVDAVGGLWNVNLGYSNKPIKKAIAKQLDALPFCNTFRGTANPPAIELARRLCELLEPEDMQRAFFTSGGSDSVESALRIARQYWRLRGQADRTKFLSFKRGYHGTHFGGASVNGSTRFRRPYEPLLAGCFHMPFPWGYRNPFGTDDEEKLTDLCLGLIEDEIASQGADTIAAFIAEPVLGAGGVYVPPPRLWKGLEQICRSNGILLISDEVITGFGRAGEWFGCRLWDVKPDMMCFAKALTCGYVPFGALMVSGEISDAFQADQTAAGTISHGYTYSGHPVGCSAALATLDETLVAADGNLPGRARTLGARMKGALEDVMRRHPQLVGEVRGLGLMMALEIVSDPVAKTPADSATMAALDAAIYEAGVLVRVSGNCMILSPSLVLSDEDADRIVAAIDAGLATLPA